MTQNSTGGMPDWSKNVWYSSPDLDTFYSGAVGGFDDVAIVPLNFTLNMVVLGSYIIAGIVFKIIKNWVGKEGFARSPWWALIVVRIIRGLMSLSQQLTWKFLGVPLGGMGPFDFISNTYFYDFGLYFIIIGQIRALYLGADLEKRGWYTFSRRLWGFTLFVMLTAGAYMSMCNFLDYATGLPKIFARLATTSHFLLGGAMIIFLVTSIAILVASITTLVSYKSIERYPGYGQWVQLIGIVSTFPFLLMRIIPDLLRTTIFRKPSLGEHIALGIIPEWAILAIWFTLAVVVPRSYKNLHTTEDEARNHCRSIWLSIFTVRVQELDPQIRSRALENMSTIQAIAEQHIEITTFKSFYDNEYSYGYAETGLYFVSWALRVNASYTMFNYDVKKQVAKVEKLVHIDYRRRPGEDAIAAFVEEARITDLVLTCVHEGVGRWLADKGHLPESSVKALRECRV